MNAPLLVALLAIGQSSDYGGFTAADPRPTPMPRSRPAPAPVADPADHESARALVPGAGPVVSVAGRADVPASARYVGSRNGHDFFVVAPEPAPATYAPSYAPYSPGGGGPAGPCPNGQCGRGYFGGGRFGGRSR